MSHSNLRNSEEVGFHNEEWNANQGVMYMSSYTNLDQDRSDFHNNEAIKEEQFILLIDKNINENLSIKLEPYLNNQNNSLQLISLKLKLKE